MGVKFLLDDIPDNLLFFGYKYEVLKHLNREVFS